MRTRSCNLERWKLSNKPSCNRVDALAYISVVVIVILRTMTVAHACNCMPVHVQQAYCNSDFVVRARVEAVLYTIPLNRTLNRAPYGRTYGHVIPLYKIYITSIWKGYDLIERNTNMHLLQRRKTLLKRFYGIVHTLRADHACALKLTVGDKYIISGNLVDGKLFMNLCNWKMKWRGHSTKRIRKQFFAKFERFDCSCTIDPYIAASGAAARCKRDSDRCCWEIDPVVDARGRGVLPCMFKTCRRKRGVCAWEKRRGGDRAHFNLCTSTEL